MFTGVLAVKVTGQILNRKNLNCQSFSGKIDEGFKKNRILIGAIIP